MELLPRWKGTFLDRSTDALMGEMCAVLGRLDDGLGHFEDAVTFCRKAGYRPELSWTLYECADLLLRRGLPGDGERARGLLAEGLTHSRALRMEPLERRILAAEEALDGQPRRRRNRADGLTRRELEVLILLARGLTNVEVAQRLFVSPLTAARHVHNLLEKTGMANRAELAAWAARQGLLSGA